MNFDLTEEQKDLKEILHKYATEVLAPRAVEIDKNNRFPKETRRPSRNWQNRISWVSPIRRSTVALVPTL